MSRAPSDPPKGSIGSGARVPQPPPPEALRASFPDRADMRAGTRHWVNDVKSLSDQAVAAVAGARQARKVAAETSVTVRRHTEKQAATVDTAARAKVAVVDKAARRIEAQHAALTAEMKLLLETRVKLRGRSDRVQKPIHDLRRRLEHRMTSVPSAEGQCDAVETDLNVAHQTMSAALQSVQAVIGQVEAHVAHMNDLAAGLANDTEQARRARDVDRLFDHTTDLSEVLTRQTSSDAGTALPSLVANIQQKAQTSPRGAPVPAPPVGGGAAGTPRHRPTLVINTERLMTLSAAAISQSHTLRQKAVAVIKELDSKVSQSSDLVETSVRRKLTDTKALRQILKDRIRLLSDEIATVDAQREKLHLETLGEAGAINASRAKVEARKAAQRVVRDVNPNDELAAVAQKETAVRLASDKARRARLNELDQQRSVLRSVLTQLEQALENKDKLLSIDRRLLEIGKTPMPDALLRASSDFVPVSARTPAVETPRSQLSGRSSSQRYRPAIEPPPLMSAFGPR